MTFVPFTADAELQAIAEGVVARTLPKPQWTHAAHFACALWLLEAGRDAQMPERIRQYNLSTGGANTDTGGYHETITLASLRAARAFRAGRAAMPLFAVFNELMASPLGRSDWLLVHWSRGEALHAGGAPHLDRARSAAAALLADGNLRPGSSAFAGDVPRGGRDRMIIPVTDGIFVRGRSGNHPPGHDRLSARLLDQWKNL